MCPQAVIKHKAPKDAPSCRALLRRGLGLDLEPSRGRPLALFVRVPAWLGNQGRHPENCVPPLDLGVAVSQARRAGLHAVLLDLETGAFSLDEVEACIRDDQPALLFVCGTTPAHGDLLSLAQRGRRAAPAMTIVAAGQHADAVPESFLFPDSPVDLCLRGDFEETTLELCEALLRGSNPEVAGSLCFDAGEIRSYGERPLVQDLDALPPPSHDFFLTSRYRYLHPVRGIGPFRWGFIQTSRGCPFPCVYCSRTLRNSFGKTYRSRSAASVVAEMESLVARGVNAIVILDDVFTHDRQRVLELCHAIRAAGLRVPWKAEGRVTPADPELFAAMRAAGCSTLSMGVESGSQRILDSLDKRTRVEDIERAFRLAKEAGLITVGFFMVGSPGEREEDFQATLRLLERVDPHLIQVAFFTIYPGSRAYDTYAERRPADWSYYQHYERALNLSDEADEVVNAWQRRLYLHFLARPRFVLRYLAMRHINLLTNAGTELFLVRQALKTLGRRVAKP